LREKTEKHEGKDLVTQYQYNHLKQLIAEKDPYGHETTYTYDRLGNQTKCINPPLQDSEGQQIFPTIRNKYNLLNQLISQIDENGHETQYSYNIYGSPIKILYPDQAQERFIYTRQGWLKQKWNADGTSISYDYDAKGQLKEKQYLNKQGITVKEEKYDNQGPLLLSETDSMGLITSYVYDGAGRKIEEHIDLKSIYYFYDDFNRLIKKEQNGRQEIFEYDWLDRLITKTSRDSLGNLYAKEAYEYDIQGNQISTTTWQTPDQQSIYRSQHHSTNLLQWKENPLKHRTQWEYDDSHTNTHGQQVQLRTISDALRRPIKETDDAHHRLAKLEHYDGQKQLSCTQYYYDPMGHLATERILVMKNGQHLREYGITRSYNKRGLLKLETEMPQGKTTHYHYDTMNRLIEKEKPDGIKLTYTYDALGRLQTLKSSDETISYTYTYDLHDNITQVQDHVHQITQNRQFDRLNRLEKEEMTPGIFLEYTYDALDRITRMLLPDGSSISYTYDPFHLRKIQRSGHNTYECDNLEYDLQRHLIKSQSPAGPITYTYDPLGRAIAIQAPHWESHLEQFDPIGNLLKMKQQDPSGIHDYHFAYDRFNHLIHETTIEFNQFAYDSLGNCLKKNDKTYNINSLNQLKNDGETHYDYDANGNLTSAPPTTYTYDALNRLINCEKEGQRTTFLYDAFARCLQITDTSGTKHLLYQKEQEIGSLVNGQLQEFRLIHPEKNELTLAIELQRKVFFPIQDFRNNICALQKPDSSLAEWTRYSAFGAKTIEGENLFNPCALPTNEKLQTYPFLPTVFTIPASCAGKQLIP
jgi:YD repeat-containing protein